MKKVFLVKGLDCANCAAKIERGICALDGVLEANVNFITQKMTIVAHEDKMESVLKKAFAVVKKTEPDAVIEGR